MRRALLTVSDTSASVNLFNELQEYCTQQRVKVISQQTCVAPKY